MTYHGTQSKRGRHGHNQTTNNTAMQSCVHNNKENLQTAHSRAVYQLHEKNTATPHGAHTYIMHSTHNGNTDGAHIGATPYTRARANARGVRAAMITHHA